MSTEPSTIQAVVASETEIHGAVDEQDNDWLSFAIRTGDAPHTATAIFVGEFDSDRCPQQGDLITLTGYWEDNDTFLAQWPPSPAH